jgi:hypothetical protein
MAKNGDESKSGGDGMLASLLPGLREVRTPLALGYLWLLNAWLIVAHWLPKKPPSHEGAVLYVFQLAGLLGKGAVLAALSFTAYLIGAIAKRAVPQFRRKVPGHKWAHNYLTEGVVGGNTRFNRWIKRQILPPPAYFKALRDLSKGIHGRLTSKYASEIIREVDDNRDDLRTRLLVSDAQLYGEYDRYTAESEFRVNVAYPLLILAIALTVEWTPLALLGLPVLLVLFWQGTTRDLEALAVLMRAVLVGKIEADYLAVKEEPEQSSIKYIPHNVRKAAVPVATPQTALETAGVQAEAPAIRPNEAEAAATAPQDAEESSSSDSGEEDAQVSTVSNQ